MTDIPWYGYIIWAYVLLFVLPFVVIASWVLGEDWCNPDIDDTLLVRKLKRL